MTKKLLQFVDLEQETPFKRETSNRRQDFNVIYNIKFKMCKSEYD